MKHDEELFEQKVKDTLDSSITQLDGETRSRLSAMRHAAFEQQPSLSRWLTFDNWLPVTSFAAVGILAVTLVLNIQHQGASEKLGLQDTDIALELLLNENDELELSDPDFYVWLDEALLDEDMANDAG